MKDFYDLWAMSRRFGFDGRVLADAIQATFARRQTEIPVEVPVGLSDEVVKSAQKQAQWRGFLRREPLVQALQEFHERVDAVREFLMPITGVARREWFEAQQMGSL